MFIKYSSVNNLYIYHLHRKCNKTTEGNNCSGDTVLNYVVKLKEIPRDKEVKLTLRLIGRY